MINKQTIKQATLRFREKVIRLLDISMILKIVAFIGIFLGIAIIIRQNTRYYKQSQEELKQYEALQVFSKIDDIAHEQYVHMQETGNPYHWTGAEEFLRMDKQYHSAKTLEERFKRAKEMNTFAKKVDIRLGEVGGLSSSGDLEREKRYQEANKLFDMLLIKS